MTWSVDPDRDWEIEWELANPEPYPKPTAVPKIGSGLEWRPFEILERVNWHKRRWEAFKTAFPNWKDNLERI